MRTGEKEIETIDSLGLKGVILKPSRRSGNTTRLADAIIQALFQGKKVSVIDHFDYGGNRSANELLFKKVFRRLEFEHGITEEHLEYKMVSTKYYDLRIKPEVLK